MKHSEKHTCLYCKFYKQTRIEHGQCRRNPPTGIGEKFVGKWPEVADTYWCGEFVAGEGAPQKISAMNYVARPKPTAPAQGKPQQARPQQARPQQTRPPQQQARPQQRPASPGGAAPGQIRPKPQQ